MCEVEDEAQQELGGFSLPCLGKRVVVAGALEDANLEFFVRAALLLCGVCVCLEQHSQGQG